MRISLPCVWLILGLVFHGLLMGGLAITLYPTTYTATAQFLAPDSERIVSFHEDVKKINEIKIYSDISNALNLEKHPLINRTLPADNTKWSALTLKIRKSLNKDLRNKSNIELVSDKLSHITQIKLDETKSTLTIEVDSQSPYLSQDIANSLLNTYRRYLQNSYIFKNYDPATMSLWSNTNQNPDKETLLAVPAGHVVNSNKKPWNLVLLFSVFIVLISGLLCANICKKC